MGLAEKRSVFVAPTAHSTKLSVDIIECTFDRENWTTQS